MNAPRHKRSRRRYQWFVILMSSALVWTHFGDATWLPTEPMGPASELEMLKVLELEGDERWVQGRWEASRSSDKALLVLTVSREDPSTFFLLQTLSQIEQSLHGRLSTLVVELPPSSEGRDDSGNPSHQPNLADFGWPVTSPIVRDAHYRLWKAMGRRPWPSVALVDPAQGTSLGTWTGDEFLSLRAEDIVAVIQPSLSSPAKHQSAEPLLNLRSSLIGVEHHWSDVTFCRGHFVIADAAAHQIHIIKETGDLTSSVGTGAPGFVNGQAGKAQFRYPSRVSCDEQRSAIFVADWGNRSIRHINLITELVTTLDTGQGSRPIDVTSGSGLLFISDGMRLSKGLSIQTLQGNQRQKELEVDHWGRNLGTMSYDPSTRTLSLIGGGSPAEILLHHFGRETWSRHTYKPAPRQHWTTPRRALDLRSQTLWQAREHSAPQVYISHLSRPDSVLIHQFVGLGRLSGISAAEDKFIAWDALSGSACALDILRQPLGAAGSTREAPAALGKESCITDNRQLDGAEHQPWLVQAAPAVVKAGSLSELDIGFDVPEGYILSGQDVHRLELPGDQVVAAPIGASHRVSWQAPADKGSAVIRFWPIVCKKDEPGRCERLHIEWPVELRESAGQSQISLRLHDDLRL